MKRLLILALLLAPLSTFGQTLAGVNGDCSVGGQQTLTSGLPNTATQQIGTTNVLQGAGVMASFPSCLATVYLTGTLTKAAIFSDNIPTPTPVSNPITANTDGSYTFFVAPGSCYDIVLSSGIGPTLPYSRTLTDVCIGTGGSSGPGGGIGGAGTPGHVPQFTSPTTIGDSEGIVTGISPAQWPLGVSLVTGALYFNRGRNVSTGTTANLLAAFDASNLVINAQPTDTNNLKGIARTTGLGGTVDVAYSGTFPCKFDNQTAFGDWVILGSGSQCHDAGATQPSGIEDIGRVSSVNAGAGTLANVDLGLPDATNTSAGGGTGVVTPCATPGAFAFYSVVGSTVICDPNVTTDGGGNVQLVSVTTNGPSSGFIGYEQGTAPTLSVANTNYFYADVSVPTSFGTAWPSAPGSVGQAVVVTQVVDPTHIKLGYSSTGCPEGTCIVNNPGLDQVIAQHDLSLTLGGVTAAYLAASGAGNGALFLSGATTGECSLTVDDNGTQFIPNCPISVLSVGAPLSSFDANIQNNANDPLTGSAFTAGIIDSGSNVVSGIQGLAQGREATGVFGLGSGTTDSSQAFSGGGQFFGFLTVTDNNTTPGNAYAFGMNGNAENDVAVGKTAYQAVGVEGQAGNTGAGTLTNAEAYQSDRCFGAGGVITNCYGYNAFGALGTISGSGTVTNSAVFHAADQGSGVNNYGILLEGVTHNDLGGGITKIGAVQDKAGQVFNVKAYGAICDGSHIALDTTGIKAALTAASAVGGNAFFPAGTCQFDNSAGAYVLTGFKGQLTGVGKASSIAFNTLANDGIDFNNAINLDIEQISFSFSPATTVRGGGYPINLDTCSNCTIDTVYLNNGNLSGMRIGNSSNVNVNHVTVSNFLANGIFTINNNDLHFNGTTSFNNADAAEEYSYYDTGTNPSCSRITSTGLTSNNDVSGFLINSCSDVSVTNFNINGAGHECMFIGQDATTTTVVYPDNLVIGDGNCSNTGYGSNASNRNTAIGIMISIDGIPATKQHIAISNVVARHTAGRGLQLGDSGTVNLTGDGLQIIDAGNGNTSATGEGIYLDGNSVNLSNTLVVNAGTKSLTNHLANYFTATGFTSINPNQLAAGTIAILNESNGGYSDMNGIHIVDTFGGASRSTVSNTATGSAHFYRDFSSICTVACPSFGGPTQYFAGLGAGNFSLTGVNNVGVGDAVLSGLTTGNKNVMMGAFAGFSLVSGTQNTGIGNSAYNLGTGSSNTVAGAGALSALTAGNNNSCFGAFCLSSQTGIGPNTCVGENCQSVLTIGTNDVGIGLNAGSTITNETKITSLGDQTNSGMTAGITQSTCVGYNCQNTASHQVLLGTSLDAAQTVPRTFSGLAACSATLEGSFAAVTNSTTATWGATITGGGANHVLAYCDGTNWTVAAQ